MPAETDAAYPPVQWGVLSTKLARAPNRACASDGETVRYTKTTTNLSFIESVLGYSCTNEGWSIFRCW
jgi:hypothetical protein